MAYTYTTINGERVQTDVANAFNNLKSAFRSAFGLDLIVSSGTRTTAEQRDIFLSRFRAQGSGNGPYGDVRWYNGTRYVRISSAGTVAVPGTSNHEEGGPIGPRALDIRDSGNNSGVTTAGNARSNWIRSNASRYGFNPAGYNFGEPWHIEYTGSFGGGSGSGGGGSSTGWPAHDRYGAAWVTEIQKKLNRLGYGVSVDGQDGPATQKAVSDFQGKHGLPQDGIAGPDTNAKLDSVLAGGGKLVVDGLWGSATIAAMQKALGVTADGEMGPNTVTALQNKLKAAGQALTIDGGWGPETIRALQNILKVTADGEMGPTTISSLQAYLNNGGKFVVSNPTTPPATAQITVDGEWGPATTKALQTLLKVAVDGEMGPNTIKALQTATGQTADGEMGPNTIKALQMNVGVEVDGELGPNTIKALQNFLNAKKSFKSVTVTQTAVITYPKPAKPTYPDASYWNHSPNSSPRGNNKVEYFVVHHAADTSAVQNQITRFMSKNDRGVSPNWLIGADGSVSEIVPPDSYRAWTTGSFDLKAVTVETQNTSGDPTWGISEDAHIAIAKLVVWASKRYGFPINRKTVIGHREVPGQATACPGPSMNLDKIVQYAVKLAEPVKPVEPTKPVDPTKPVEPTKPTPTPEVWTISLPKSDAVALGKSLDAIRKLLP